MQNFGRENFDDSTSIRQIRQTFPPSVLRYTVRTYLMFYLLTVDTIKGEMPHTEETTFTSQTINGVHSVDVSTNITFGNYLNNVQELCSCCICKRF